MVRMVRVVEPAAVRHPETGDMVVPDPKVPHREDDIFVQAYPWMFAADEDRDADEEPRRVETVAIETASVDPATQTVRRGRSRTKSE